MVSLFNFFIVLAYSIQFLGNNSILQLLIFIGACLTLFLFFVDYSNTFTKKWEGVLMLSVIIIALLITFWNAVQRKEFFNEQTSLGFVFLTFAMFSYSQYKDKKSSKRSM